MTDDQAHYPIPEPSAAAFAGAVEASDPPADLIETEDSRELIASVGYSTLLKAVGELGVCEGPGNTGVPWHRYVQTFEPNRGPEPWCAYFVSWSYLQATRRTPPWRYKGAVESVREWAAGAGALVQRPVQGDMFGYGGEHMGLVRGILPDGFWSVEGNTSSGCVKSNRRWFSGLWFARLR
jgi:hypothetical protein